MKCKKCGQINESEFYSYIPTTCKKCWGRQVALNRIKIRLQAFDVLGGKCGTCGNSNPKHLTIDHVSGGGTQERKSVPPGKLYRMIRDKLVESGMYQLICANCNQEKLIDFEAIHKGLYEELLNEQFVRETEWVLQ